MRTQPSPRPEHSAGRRHGRYRLRWLMVVQGSTDISGCITLTMSSSTALAARHSLRTRPVSWTSPPADEPEMRCSRIELTSEAAVGGKAIVSRCELARNMMNREATKSGTHRAWRSRRCGPRWERHGGPKRNTRGMNDKVSDGCSVKGGHRERERRKPGVARLEVDTRPRPPSWKDAPPQPCGPRWLHGGGGAFRTLALLSSAASLLFLSRRLAHDHDPMAFLDRPTVSSLLSLSTSYSLRLPLTVGATAARARLAAAKPAERVNIVATKSCCWCEERERKTTTTRDDEGRDGGQERGDTKTCTQPWRRRPSTVRPGPGRQAGSAHSPPPSLRRALC